MSASAPATTTLAGRIVEADLPELGVPDATVRVDGIDAGATSDGSGHFVLHDLPAGDVVLSVDAPGYRPATRVVPSAERGRPVTVELTWAGERYESQTLAEAASRPQTASTTTVTPRDIRAAPLRNAEDILRQVPGLTLVQHGSEGKGHQFFMRGFDATHGADLELTLEGIPLNEWSNVHAQGYLDLGLVIQEVVRGVTVTKGPFALDQGAFAMAGSADYRLGTPTDELGWRAAYTVGTTNRHRLFAGYSPPGDSGDEFVGVEATHDDGFGERRRLDRATFNGRFDLFDSEQNGRMSLLALTGYSSFALPGTLRNDEVEAGVVDFYDAYDPRAEGTSARALVGLSYGHDSDRRRLRATGYAGYRRLELLENFTGFLIDPENGDRREQVQDTWSFGAAAEHQLELSEPLVLRTGVGLRGDMFEQTEDSVGRDLERLSRRRDLDGVQMMGHAIVGLRWSPVETLRVDAGARADLAHVGVRDRLEGLRDAGTLFVASPRATARWQPLDEWKLFAAYGRGFRPPEARAFSGFEPERTGIGEETYTGGEPAVTVSDAVEAGTRWSPARWLGIMLAGFATFIERESVFDHVSGINLDLNATRRLGGELVLESEPLPWLQLGADVTVVDARFVESGNRVPLAPRLTSGGRVVVTHPIGLRAGLRVLVVAPRPLPHGATGATLVRTDATLGYRWRWLRVDLEIENLLDRRLREGEYHYASHWRREQTPSQIPVLHTTAGPPLNARLTLGVLF